MKGQSSIELIVIFAVSLIALGAIISISNSQMNTLNAQKQKQTALTSVNDLAEAVKDVYSQGPGAKKKVFFQVPGNVDASESGIGNKSIYLNVLGSDVIADTGIEVSGSIPTAKGGYWLWVTAGENYVIIGTSSITLSNNSFYVSMLQDSNETVQLGITNNGSSDVNIGIEPEWTNSEVTLVLSDTNFTVIASDTNTIDLNFSSSSTAVGNYTGNLVIDVNYGSSTERIIVPINVEVIVSGDGEGGVLFVFPSSYASTISAGGSDTNAFNMCNNSGSDLSDISFDRSTGDAGEWVDNIPSLLTLVAGTCKTISFIITVPGGTSSGSYAGTITATDGTNSDDLSFYIAVPSSMASVFSFSWSGAYYPNNVRVNGWTIENTSASSTITIDRMTVRKWSEMDQDGATLNRIQLNGGNVWTGTGNDGDELDITDFTIPVSTSYSNNDLRWTASINDDEEQFIIEFTFSDGSSYTTAAWPVIYYLDLWELNADLPQPLDFSTDINSAGNSFGADAGNDGWDWTKDIYQPAPGINSHCVMFNADPDYDNSIADSTVGADNRIIVHIGDYDNSCQNSGTIASGAYGVQFEVSSEHYAVISGGGTATLAFSWVMDDHGLDGGEEAWIKARFGNAGGMNYLGSNLDGGDDAADPDNEIEWDNNPNDHSGSESIDLSSYITAAGTYYLEFGGKIHGWGNNEWLEAEFDNINLVIQ